MQEDLEVTGISRSGRVRKKSSKLMDFESPDDIEAKFRRQTPAKAFSGYKDEPQQSLEYQETVAPRPMEEAGTASGSEDEFYENNDGNNDSMETDSSGSDNEASTRTPANSLYMMEKSAKKKLIVKDGKVIGRTKAQRKDKGKTRITAYMMWAKEARNDLLRKHPDMDFSAISKRLGEMWSNVNYNERYLWKRKAKRFAMQKEQSLSAGVNKIISNPTIRPQYAGPGRPPTRPKQLASPTAPSQQAVVVAGSAPGGSMFRVSGTGAVQTAAHLRLLGESLAIIGARLKEHEGQIAVSGSVSVLLDTLLCALAPLLCVCGALPALAPPAHHAQRALANIAYIMPGL